MCRDCAAFAGPTTKEIEELRERASKIRCKNWVGLAYYLV